MSTRTILRRLASLLVIIVGVAMFGMATGIAAEAIAWAAKALPKTTVQAVSEALACQCGCGLTVANCNHPQCEFSVPVREQIESMIGKGKGRSEIVAFFRAKYGEKILSAPTTEGFNLLAWIMPFAVLASGGALIFLAFGRWRRRRAPATAGAAAPIDPELKRRLDSEVREQI